MTFNEFKNNVELWAAERGIYEHSSTSVQLMKALSELGELADAIIKVDDEALKDAVGDVAVCVVNAAYMEDVGMDEIGEAVAEFEAIANHTPDTVGGYLVGCASIAIGQSLTSTSFGFDEAIEVISALAGISAIRGLDLMDCCEHAWNEIKDRKGRMVAGGAFVKEGDA